MRTLFISDLHLEPEKPSLNDFFFRFLDQIAAGADELFILGDFFEVWVGDDEQLPLHQEVAHRLAQLAEEGTDIRLMVGNRDFLITEAYAGQCGATLVSEPYVTAVGGLPALLMHGDSLCTDDKEYQKFRALSRSPAWQQQILSQPLEQRQKTARQLREISLMRNQGKPMEIMDVNADAVIQALQEHGVNRLIHGHTHRPDRHQHLIPGQGVAERIVLGDWHEHTHYLEVVDQELNLIRLDASELS